MIFASMFFIGDVDVIVDQGTDGSISLTTRSASVSGITFGRIDVRFYHDRDGHDFATSLADLLDQWQCHGATDKYGNCFLSDATTRGGPASGSNCIGLTVGKQKRHDAVSELGSF